MADFYADSSVGGPGAGTFGDPWDDYGTHVAGLNAGDTLYLRGNAVAPAQIYNETMTTLAPNGTAVNPITIKPYNNELVTLRESTGLWNNHIFVINGDYWIVEGMDLDKQGNNGGCIDITNGDNNTILDCTIHSVVNDWINRIVNGDDNTFDSCTIYDGFRANNLDAFGILISGGADNIITGCEIYDIYGDCIQIINTNPTTGVQILDNELWTNLANCAENGIDMKRNDSTQAVIRGNTIHGFRFCDATCGGTGGNGEGIVLHFTADNVLVEFNTIYNCATGIRAQADDITIQRNVFRDMATDAAAPFETAILVSAGADSTLIYNNTIHNCIHDSIYILATATNYELYNNIFNDCGTATLVVGATGTPDYNCWWNCTSILAGANDVLADPLFVDEATDDYHLDDGSPCIGVGVDVGLGYLDLGAFEYAGAPPVPFTPFCTGAGFQSRELTLVAKTPLWGDNTLVSDSLRVDGLRVIWTAQGGWWSLTFNLRGRQSEVEDWIDAGLGRQIQLYSPDLMLIWDGYVSKVTGNIGGLSITRGPLIESVANKVQVAYSTVDYAVTPPAVGVRDNTAWAENAASQARYGIIERVISLAGSNPTNAAQVRDTVLGEMAEPISDETDNIGSASETSVTVECLGWVHWLNAYTYYSAVGGSTTATAKMQAVLGADPNSIFSADYGAIATNATAVGSWENKYPTAYSVIKSIVSLGDAAFNRYLLGVYAGRKAKYNAIPTAPKYQRALADPGQWLELFGSGGHVEPWNVEPGEWTFYTDLLIGQSQSTTLRVDPRYLLIEQAQFSQPWALTLQGGKSARLDQLLARMGLAGSSG